MGMTLDGDISHDVSVRAERIRQRGIADSMRYYRALGFRRVGTSGYFAWISAADHASKALEAKDDYDPPV
ncbi:Uu.00g135070.m01.CDS01 [Anthostomella pinea]|uniref:Uu.00g135070.m01.CDS01 n=1 Tax=Anthostomella pinea TaxID=933095 RepID=A0AAI8VP32_9PEZI|nr:Uu.00g135070.m01.CDS01 [Anthostomella pinea]